MQATWIALGVECGHYKLMRSISRGGGQVRDTFQLVKDGIS